MKPYSVRQLEPGETVAFRALLDMFGEAFDDKETYSGAQPGAAYLEERLASSDFILLAGFQDAQVIGGLAAYVLKKFEQERSEIYIYDLAVAQDQRRKGIATALIEELKRIGTVRGACVIYVQADVTDPPAIALYTKLGTREDVLHFDIEIP